MRHLLLDAAVAASMGLAASAAHAQHTARDMWHLYQSTPADCGSSTRPAFLCSGIVLRVTVPGNGYYSWHPAPLSDQDGGVSFSYIRKDAKFIRFKGNETNGFTLYPLLGDYKYQGPDTKGKLDVLCAFPLDAWTNGRGPVGGCGANPTYPAGAPCQKQGITTAAQWLAHYQQAQQVGQPPYYYQCGFDVSDESSNTAPAFAQMLQAMSLLGNASLYEQNEIRIKTWPDNWNTQLPIQSFFYLDTGGSQGLSNAQKDQKDYYTVTKGGFIPIVKITVPQQAGQDYDFHFLPGDQAVPIPAS
ncbi:hypothetical protein [Bordetella flabilis]|uniref:Uncharacterized protein n=1 Tax=Bordetella flabilis TaxID=463014 RepID=A0A193GG95_9BORD|nr:hypothetical protein [Bordetella flabilis]ANN79077.1 hypothetical protein BAU07_19890 [Bordetella flabilis]